MSTSLNEMQGRYRLRHKLGEGGMGEVYAAQDRLTGTSVALKRVLLTPNELIFNTRLAFNSDVDLRRILANEFKVLASLRHPHIISVLDYGFDAERYPYYTMTLLEKPRTIIDAAKSFSFNERLDAFAQMLQALAYLHRRGILHRDLKPGNVLIDQDNSVKLLDFGLATQDSVRGTTGTLAYMPPEIIRQGEATPQSDLYSIGIVAYELFTGQYPFLGEKANDLIDQLMKHMPDMKPVPVNLRPILLRMLMKDPSDRYPDAESILSDLAGLTDGAIGVEDETVRESFLQAARFIGREHELSLLTQHLDIIGATANGEVSTTRPGDKEGCGAAFLIGGESGAGKSRLLEEARTHALLNGALVLRGQCVAESAQPFHMWRDVVRRLLLETQISDIEASVLFEIVPDLPDLLERPVTPAPQLAAISAQTRLIEAIIGLFQKVNQPTMLIFEDLQWATDSLIPLRGLLDVCATLPILIVGSYRNEEAPNLPAQLPEMHTLILGRLTDEEIADLSRAMIGAAGQQQMVLDYLQQQSEGNVLFLVEVMRALAQDAGNLRAIGTKTLPMQIFAGGIEKIIARRMDRLPAEAAPTLQLAAVAGRVIDENLMRHLIGSDADRWLQAGLNASILEVQDAQWRFAHDRLRDAIIALIPPGDLPRYHERIAEGLEALYPDTTSLTNVLYDHWRLAGNSEKEAYYAVLAMEQRLLLGVLNEANQMMEKALSLKPRDPHIQLKLYTIAGEIYFDLGKVPQSIDAYTEAMRLAQRLNLHTIVGKAMEGLGNAASAVSDFDTAARWYQESLKLRREIGDMPGVASSLHFMSVLFRLRGKYPESLAALTESMNIRREHDTRSLGDSLYQLGVHARLRGDYHEAIGYLEEGIVLRRGMADGRGLADDLNNLGLCYMLAGDYPLARTTLVESLTHRQVRDNERGVASSHNALGELSVAEMNFGAAIRSFGIGLALWLTKQDPWNIGNSNASLGYAQARAGELLSAKYFLDQGLQFGQRVAAMFVTIKSLIGWAQVKLQEGDDFHAALLLGAVESQPAMTAQLRLIYLNPVLMMLDLDTHAAAFAAGKDSDIQAMISMMLAEYKPG